VVWHDRTKGIFESGIDGPIDVGINPSLDVECSGRILQHVRASRTETEQLTYQDDSVQPNHRIVAVAPLQPWIEAWKESRFVGSGHRRLWAARRCGSC
jgi:hypothetical protein